MNSYCASVCSSSEYQDKLTKYGYSINGMDSGTGKSHNDIAQLMHDSYVKLRPQFSDVGSFSGAPRRVQRKQVRQFRKATVKDSNDIGGLHLSWMTIVMGILAFVVSGPVGFAVCVLCCIFEYYLEKDLDGDKALLQAVGA